MPMTTDFRDAARFATAITAVGGVVPGLLANLLSSWEVLSTPAATQRPEDPIMDAVLAGKLTAKRLAELAPAAAAAASTITYTRELARNSEHTLVGEWHRQIKAGGADAILDSLRPSFDKHAAAIAKARSLIDPESSAEHILASAAPEMVAAWQGLDGHLRAIGAIAAVARQFGPRLGDFPQITEYTLGDGFRLVDSAIMCCDGASLELDSAPFHQADQGHRTSPWFKVPRLRLHSIESAQARYNRWAADQWDAQHSGPQGGRLIDGVVVPDVLPPNPYRQKANA